MKNQLIILVLSLTFLPLISYGQGTSKKTLKKAAKELCSCMDRLEVDPMDGATCMQEFADNDAYKDIGQEEFMGAMEKACPKAAQRFMELADAVGEDKDLNINKSPKAEEKEQKTSKKLMKKATKELCGCMDRLEVNPMDGANCMQEFGQKEEYQDMGQEEFMKAMYKECPKAAKRFEELAKLVD